MTDPDLVDHRASEVWRLMAEMVLDNERRREVSEAAGLSFGKLRALRRLARRDMAMRDLAALLTVDAPNLTAMVDDLERRGLVERHAHPTDRRIKVVAITPAGRDLANRAQAILDRPPEGLAKLPPQDIETLAGILRRARR